MLVETIFRQVSQAGLILKHTTLLKLTINDHAKFLPFYITISLDGPIVLGIDWL